MENIIYQTVKNLGMQYVAPLVLGATLLIGCGKEENIQLPVELDTITQVQYIQKEREDKLEGLVREYRDFTNKALLEFNGMLKDGQLTRTEQEKVYQSLEEVYNQKARVRDYAGDLSKDVDLTDHTIDSLYDLLNENLNGVDWGAPELEIKLRQQLVPIYVERVDDSKGDMGAYIVITLGCLFIGMLAYYTFKSECD